MSIAAIIDWFGAERMQNHELGRQLQSGSEARIAFLLEGIEALEKTIDGLGAQKRALIDQVQTEKQRAAATAAEIEARDAAMSAILEGPRDTDKAAA